ncbi:hypothetical protein ZWY2020_031208 [Hordeum vulgare]|nr:hypothetical protein ZWY2020_031208 [Hordeum vulgare]
MLRCDIDSSNSSIHRFCHDDTLPWFVYALEPPGSHRAEEAILLASTAMFVLGSLLFVLSFVSRVSGRGIFITPTVGIFLYASLSLFLPLMSYMLSQAKQSNGGGELPFYAHVILIWMLLVELFRKKVDAMLAAVRSSPLRAVHQQTLWGGIDQFVRISWIGYLIYTNVHGFRKPGFIILWALTIAKAAHRVAAVELAKTSFAIGKNPHLVVGYTAQMMAQEEEEMRDGDQAQAQAQAADGTRKSAALVSLSKCWYAVMGEEKWKAGRDGCSVQLLPLPAETDPEGKKMKKKKTTTKKKKKKEEEEVKTKTLITVGDIWELAESGNCGRPAADPLLDANPALKDLCLSFALFKLLRARFENLPVHEGVARKNRGFIFELGNGKDEEEAERAFQVIERDLSLVANSYHSASVIPAVLCGAWFLVGNSILVLLITLNQAFMVIYVTGNAQLVTVVACLARDVAKSSPMAADLYRCLCRKLLMMLTVTVSSINVGVCFILFFSFLLMEAWELVVYLLSDSFLVSLLCSYARRPRWQSSRCVRRALGALLWVKRVGRARAGVRFNQLCVLGLRRRRLHTLRVMISQLLPLPFFLGVPSVVVPKEVKRAVFASLRAKCGGEPLSNGAAVLRQRRCTQLEWACKSRSITVVIIVWHIATTILELDTKSSPAVQGKGSQAASTEVARTLSRYCMHLVACAPELLPGDVEGSKLVYQAMKRDVRSNKWRRSKKETVASMGDKLGTQLLEECTVEEAWSLLAELWTELVVYLAPSDNIEGHAMALAKGGEFVTTLWAFATHAGITR